MRTRRPTTAQERSQRPTLREVAELCEARKAQTKGDGLDVLVSYRGRGPRVLSETCGNIRSMVKAVDRDHTEEVAALKKEVARLRGAVRDWQALFGTAGGAPGTAAVATTSGALAMTPAASQRELASLRLRVRDLEADREDLRRLNRQQSAQLAAAMAQLQRHNPIPRAPVE